MDMPGALTVEPSWQATIACSARPSQAALACNHASQPTLLDRRRGASYSWRRGD
jgi:hypothetical protein